MHGFVGSVLSDKGSQLFTVTPRTTVRQAVHEMNANGIGALLVMEHGRPFGIFTERDVLRRVVDTGIDPDKTCVADVMSTDLVVVEPGTPVVEAMALMTRRRFRHLPVVEGGRIAGLISIGDLTRWVSMNQETHIQYLVEYITGKTEP